MIIRELNKEMIVCDRHTRQHTRLNNTHCVFYKMNTSELFCQLCVDWVRYNKTNEKKLVFIYD